MDPNLNGIIGKNHLIPSREFAIEDKKCHPFKPVRLKKFNDILFVNENYGINSIEC